MAGGGSILAMIQSLKFNKHHLKSKRMFNKEKSFMGLNTEDIHISHQPLKFKKATEAELAALRSKVKQEEKQQRIYILIGVGMLVFLAVFLVFQYSGHIKKVEAYEAEYGTLEEQTQLKEQEKRENAYNFYMDSGDVYLAKRKYHNAYFQYNLAHDIYFDDYYSFYKKTYALCLQCTMEQKDCNKAKELVDDMLVDYPANPEVLKLKELLGE